jgi:uncharacterized repeat protein (TIGR02543 family)
MAPEAANTPTALTPNGFAWPGYTFEGWNTVATGGGASYANGASYPFTAGATLYAQWKAKPRPTRHYHTVFFEANGGSGGMGTETHSLPAALIPAAFTRAGYTFAGWNTAANGDGTSYGNGATYSFASNATLHARWTLRRPTHRHRSSSRS